MKGWINLFSDAALAAHEEWWQSGQQRGRQIVVEGMSFAGSLLREAPFDGVKFARCDFRGADLSGTSFGVAELADCNFDGAILRNTYFSGSPDTPLSRCRFLDANLIGAEMPRWIDNCDFTRAELTDSNFAKVECVHSRFVGANFINSKLNRSHFEDCDFRGATFRDARAHRMNFVHSDLRDADFDGMRLDHAGFIRCALHGMRGRPLVEGSYVVESADVSAGFDGSRIDDVKIERAWGPAHQRDDE